MYRSALEELRRWKNSPTRKPLVLQGARQVGKTWLMREFGRLEYEDAIYVNFDAEPRAATLFSGSLAPGRILQGLEILTGKKIRPESTLLIFDEIQEVPRALASLKYFCEEAPQCHIVCAGSLLGIALHEGTSFPVGKVDFLRILPLSFREFLMATGMERYAALLSTPSDEMVATFRDDFIDALRHYYFVGGMPEAVQSYALRHDLPEVRIIQRRILDAYEQDFSKHAPGDIVPRIRMVWNSIPSQLAKENRKFVYGIVREGGRAKDFETAIMWLCDCGLVHRLRRASAPSLPLMACEDLKAFKLFLLDVGLLGCLAGLSQETLLDGNSLFTEFKGALTEQYAMQELATCPGLKVCYYSNDKGTCEIDFLLDDGKSVVPLEVKAEENLRAKSLRAFRDKHHPEVCFRASMSDYRSEGWLVNLPLFAVGELGKDIQGWGG